MRSIPPSTPPDELIASALAICGVKRTPAHGGRAMLSRHGLAGKAFGSEKAGGDPLIVITWCASLLRNHR